MSVCRSNYTLLSHIPDDPLYNQPPPPQPEISAATIGGLDQQLNYYESQSGEKNKLKSERAAAFDWQSIDQRMIQHGRIGTTAFPSSLGVQRHSSGSSFGESSISGDYYVPSLSNSEVGLGHSSDGGGELTGKAFGTGGESSYSFKSWAQQTEESYQLQLALALRLSSEATCADDPNSLDQVPNESAGHASSPGSTEAISHRFWVNGCLSYYDKVPNGFYSVHGMDPYFWAVCSDLQESGRIPSLDSLKTVDPAVLSSVEVILVDRRGDSSLQELQNRIQIVASSSITTKKVVDELAKLVCNHMGHASCDGEDDLITIWREYIDDLKYRLGSIVLPIGSLSVGLCRHRSLLFKVLADTIGLPCRIAKGCKYCTREDASSCLVRFDLDREYLIDLIEKPGCLCEPDSLPNGPSTISISSPLRFPRLKQLEPTIDFRLLAKQYFLDFESLNRIFDDSLAVGTSINGDTRDSMHPRHLRRTYEDGASSPHSSSNQEDVSSVLPVQTNLWMKVHGKESLLTKPLIAEDVVNSTDIAKGSRPSKFLPPTEHKVVQPRMMPGPRGNMNKVMRFSEGDLLVSSKSSGELAFDVEELNIPWNDIVLKERIGTGSFGTVLRADWNGFDVNNLNLKRDNTFQDVAVKILMEQDFHGERFKEFLREVAIMKRLRHPNIVLFMGAVTEPPNLSIVTEYLSRGSLYGLLRKHNTREVLDEKRRLSMAYDVANGMNYLHNHNPPIVHRDLKSPNLLVDENYTVKVCDFGLSRLKANTFLSSKSAAGTPEWMAPEVLCNEPSNEKSDVYSFGVILWELATLQQPWDNLTPMQVVAAVGFKKQRLEIPQDMNPQIAAIIVACWAK
ncbi:serine/threonine-protein kinase ctr1 [Phtheirospermum japonicum]|uniref:non-specific serine/threonine protein kinase n=1 Tax=Phtheirospermum japonicum TaxID=374723 RepID=A0A830BT76_9LAMI|nr:serine/threonine-protein kinase ctr1 [Phtheirospermum japonicum]